MYPVDSFERFDIPELTRTTTDIS